MNLFLIQSGKKNYIVGMIDLARNNKNTDQLKFPNYSWYGIMGEGKRPLAKTL